MMTAKHELVIELIDWTKMSQMNKNNYYHGRGIDPFNVANWRTPPVSCEQIRSYSDKNTCPLLNSKGEWDKRKKV